MRQSVLNARLRELQESRSEELYSQILREATTALADPDQRSWSMLSSGNRLMIGGEVEKELYPQDLAKLRAMSFKASYQNPYAKSIIKNFVKYVVGRGSILQLSDVPNATVNDRVMEWWMEFEKRNKWKRKQQEIIRRMFRDGEVFIRFREQFNGSRGRIKIHFLEPDWFDNSNVIIGPNGVTAFSYGIETQRDDVTEVIAYHMTGPDNKTVRLSPQEIYHEKIEVDENVKRGRSILETVLQDIEEAYQFKKYRLIANKIRTAIVIHEKKGLGSAQQIRAQIDAQKTQKNDDTRGTNRLQAPKPGTRIVTDANTEIEFKGPNLEAGDASHDYRMILLGIAAGVSLPEYLVTADSSNQNFACHDQDTQILTKRGWLNYDQLNEMDSVATFNTETEYLEYQQPKEIFINYYEGQMLNFHNNRDLDIMVTPNHRMYVTKDQYRRRNGKMTQDGLKPWQFKKAEELTDYSYRIKSVVKGFQGKQDIEFHIPAVEYKTGMIGISPRNQQGLQSKTVSMDIWLQFLGYYISEGWILKKGNEQSVYHIGLKQNKGFCAEKIQYILNQMPFRWKHYERRERNGTLSITWQCNDKALWTWLHENIGAGAKSKRIPEFMKDLDSSLLHYFIDAMVEGDGFYVENGDTRYYFTSSEQLKDDMMELGFKAGYKVGENKRMSNGVYYIKFKKPRRNQIYKRNKEEVNYQGIVWCVSVPNQTIITRRNGEIAITGNSIKESVGPALKEFEMWQEFFEEVYLEIFFRSLDYAINGGLLPELARQVEPKFQFPQLQVRDLHQDMQAMNVLRMNGAISKTTMASRAGLDYEEEVELMSKERETEMEWGIPDEDEEEETKELVQQPQPEREE